MRSFKKKKGFWQFFVNGFTLTRNQIFSSTEASKSRRILLDPMVIFSKGHNHNRKKWDLLKKKKGFWQFFVNGFTLTRNQMFSLMDASKSRRILLDPMVIFSKGHNHNRKKWDLLKKKRDFDSFSWMDLLWPETRSSHRRRQVKVDEFY